MRDPLFIITNNPLAKKNFSEKYVVEFIDGNVEKVYTAVRDRVHLGHRILTHPLMSSVKPNETPYRTVCISKELVDGVDMQSLNIIESSIMTLHKFLNMSPVPEYSDEVYYDFQVIDYDLINNAITL